MKTGLGWPRLAASVMVCLAAAAGFSASASDNDHERAMQALQSGQIKPLADILAVLSASEAGRVVEVELEQKRGRWIYEFKLLEQNGLVREVKVDARDGEILQSKYDD